VRPHPAVPGEVRRRLDTEMVRRGLAVTRSEAALAIRSGKVVVSGRPAMKAGTMVRPDEPIALSAPARKYVSRGGEKLEAALDRFDIDVEGLDALDAGASTGGFTDCLLARGAERVVAVDVGYGQLDWRLREDPRVTVLERVNVRELRPELLPYAAEIMVADLSFISLRLALPALVRCASPDARFVLLVKPQFEAGRAEVGDGGVVRDPEVWRRVVAEIADCCREEGARVMGTIASPLLGPAGNVEFFVHAQRSQNIPRVADSRNAVDFDASLDAAIEEGIALLGGSAPAERRISDGAERGAADLHG
jgi:23S rRNA (cytidine1920-2'-O)/16S rRNA (cytidine1409-2'-O)-methyltransferase